MIVVPDAEKQTERFPDVSRFITPSESTSSRGSDLYALFRATYKSEGGDPVAVAVKSFRPGSGDTARFYTDMTKRVVAHGDLINSLQHENIVRFIGVLYGTINEIPSFVMPLYEQNLLEATVKKGYTAENKLGWVKQIAAAMQYLHARQPPIIHGNLQASNVLLDSQGRCVVSDVGTLGDLVDGFVFNSGLGPRRAPWTAPELVANWLPNQTGNDDGAEASVPFTIKTDSFAFAITLIEIYDGGKRPFGDVPGTIVMTRIVNGDRPDLPHQILLNDALMKVVVGCWAMDPTARLDFDDVCVKLGLTCPVSNALAKRCSVV